MNEIELSFSSHNLCQQKTRRQECQIDKQNKNHVKSKLRDKKKKLYWYIVFFLNSSVRETAKV